MKRQCNFTLRCIIERPYKYNIHLFQLDLPLWRYDIFNTGMIDCCVVLCCVVLCCVVLCCVVLCCVVFMSKEIKIRNVSFDQRYWRVVHVYRTYSTTPW
jgi:hypothetical protein